jgi:DivIVA domain-containing protein
MELTSRTFREVRFRDRSRGGYHPDDVDEFLEQAAVAADELQKRLQDAIERAERLERSVREQPVDDMVKRVLVLAQKAADDAVSDAKGTADGIVSEAREKASAMLRQAEERAKEIGEKAEVEARDALRELEARREKARVEADLLSEWTKANKQRLVSLLREAAHSVETGFTQVVSPKTFADATPVDTPAIAHDGAMAEARYNDVANGLAPM